MVHKIGNMGFIEHTDKFFGNYRGLVMDNVDPDKLGRIKVKIYPMLSGVETINLPWAVPAMILNTGAGEDYGAFSVPDINTNVWIFFEAGDIYQPVYFAEATDGIKGLPSDKDTDYPETSVIRTKTGIQIKINRKEDSEDIRIDHPKGSWVEFYSDGKITIHTTDENGVLLFETDETDINILAKKGDIVVDSQQKTTTISGYQGVKIESGITTLRAALDTLITTLTSWQGDDPQGGTVTPNAATIVALNSVKSSIDSVLIS